MPAGVLDTTNRTSRILLDTTVEPAQPKYSIAYGANGEDVESVSQFILTAGKVTAIDSFELTTDQKGAIKTADPETVTEMPAGVLDTTNRTSRILLDTTVEPAQPKYSIAYGANGEDVESVSQFILTAGKVTAIDSFELTTDQKGAIKTADPETVTEMPAGVLDTTNRTSRILLDTTVEPAQPKYSIAYGANGEDVESVSQFILTAGKVTAIDSFELTTDQKGAIKTADPETVTEMPAGVLDTTNRTSRILLDTTVEPAQPKDSIAYGANGEDVESVSQFILTAGKVTAIDSFELTTDQKGAIKTADPETVTEMPAGVLDTTNRTSRILLDTTVEPAQPKDSIAYGANGEDVESVSQFILTAGKVTAIDSFELTTDQKGAIKTADPETVTEMPAGVLDTTNRTSRILLDTTVEPAQPKYSIAYGANGEDVESVSQFILTAGKVTAIDSFELTTDQKGAIKTADPETVTEMPAGVLDTTNRTSRILLDTTVEPAQPKYSIAYGANGEDVESVSQFILTAGKVTAIDSFELTTDQKGAIKTADPETVTEMPAGVLDTTTRTSRILLDTTVEPAQPKYSIAYGAN